MILRAILFSLATCLPPAAGAVERMAGPFVAEVVETVDGDTLDVRVKVWLGVEIATRVRIRGIDTPEKRGKCPREIEMAQKATDLLRIETTPQLVLRNVEGDKYFGRIDADVSTSPDGLDLREAMLRSGLARPYNGEKRGDWCGLASLPQNFRRSTLRTHCPLRCRPALGGGFLNRRKPMQALLVVLRAIHIFAGVFWAGFVFIGAVVTLPGMRTMSPEGRALLRPMMESRRAAIVSAGSAALSVISGLLLFWLVYGFGFPWSAAQWAFAIGGVFAVLSPPLGGPVGKLLAPAGSGGANAADPSVANEQRINGMAAMHGVTVLLMAVARYLT
jgi:endonuclease YncB( thermonuclease family)